MPTNTVEMARVVIFFIVDRVSIFFIADRVSIFFIASGGRFGYQREETSGVIERAPEENRRPYEQS
jgi:hypothetical protein